MKIILKKSVECIKKECKNYSLSCVKQLLTKQYDFTNTSKKSEINVFLKEQHSYNKEHLFVLLSRNRWFPFF